MANCLNLSTWCRARAVLKLHQLQTELRTTHSTMTSVIAKCQDHIPPVTPVSSSDSEVDSFMKPVLQHFSDDIIIRNWNADPYDRDLCHFRHQAMMTNISFEFSHLRHTSYASQTSRVLNASQIRNEWLRYNLAMRDSHDEIFRCSSPGESAEKPEAEDHAELYKMRDYLADHVSTNDPRLFA